MANVENVSIAVQKYFDSKTSKRNDRIDSCLSAIKSWISSKREFQNAAENYKFVSMKVLPLWNEVIGQDIASPDVFTVHEIVFDLLSNLQFDVNDIHWLKIKCKISLKYVGKLISVQKYGRAEFCLDFAEKKIQELADLTSRVNSQKNTPADARQYTIKEEGQGDLLICHLYRIEIYSARETYLEARNYLQKIKVNLLGLLDDASRKYLTALCFNIGLGACQQKKYEESVFWLTQSYEISDSIAENQTSTLLLLAEAHMMLDTKHHYEEAIIALCKVDCEHKDFDTNLMKLKAYIGSDAAPDDIRKIILHFYKTADLDKVKLLQIFFALQCSNEKFLLHEAMLTFESIFDLSYVGKIFEMHLKIMLKEHLFDEADEVVKSFINAISRSVPGNEPNTTERMLLLIDGQANFLKEQSMFGKAVCWFDYGLQISNHVVETASDLQKIKFYQQKCSCLLEMDLCNEAEEMLFLAEEQMPHHIINKFLRLKLCIMQNDEFKAIGIIEAFDNALADSDDIAQILIMCAEFSMNKLRIKIALSIFESVIGKLSRESSMIVVLRCIIKLKLQSQSNFANKIDQEWMYQFLLKVRKGLDLISEDKVMTANEAKWFMKVFWNIAHGEKENPLFVHRLLDCCSKILSLCDPNDIATLVQRNTCILISVTAGLKAVRSSSMHNPKQGPAQELTTSFTKSILENIIEFRCWSVKLDPTQLNQELSAGFRSMQRMLLVSEFEVKVILHSHDLEDVFERAFALPDIDEKTFELLAAIANRGGSHCYSLTVRSLRAAIGKLLEKPHDYEHLARLYHSLLCVVLEKMENNTAYKMDFWKIINEVYELIKSATDDKFPQSELLWFITKTWNNSIKLYLQFGCHNEALALSQLALGMSDHLISLKEDYQTKMKLLYDQMSQPSISHFEAEEN